MSASVRSRMRSLSFLSAIVLLAGVLVPLMGTPAQATHDTRTLEVTPETADAETGVSHVLTATLSAAPLDAPIEIDFEVESGPAITPGGDDNNTPMSPDRECVVAIAETTCTVSFTSNAEGTNLVRAWIDHDGVDNTDPTAAGPDGDEMRPDEPLDESFLGDPLWFAAEEPNTTDAVEVTWAEAAASEFVLDCEPETATGPVGTAHMITCTANAADDDAPAPGKQIDVEMSGANDPDGAESNETPDLTCTTGVDGSCTVTHPAAAATTNGTTTYRAWIDEDGSNATVEANTDEPADETTDPVWLLTGDDPNATDVVEKTWTGGPDTLAITPETDTGLAGSCSAYTILLTTGTTPVAGARIDVEQVHEASAAPAGDEPDVGFCTPSTGTNPSAVNEAGGDLVETPDNPATAGGETAQTTDASGQITIGITVAPAGTSDGSGEVVVTAFLDSNNDDDASPGEPVDTATQTWEPGGARTIECLPPTGDSDTGTDYEITCTVEDREGGTVGGVAVVFEETGSGDFASPADEAGTTDSNGVVKTHVSSAEAGEQEVTATIAEDTGAGEPADVDECDRASGDPTGAPAGQCQDTALVTWVSPIDDRCDDPGVICGTDGDDVLVGTAGDDLIICGDGDDVVEAMGGNDRIECGRGNDEVDGGAGNDKIFGARGNDTLKGAGGRDAISGGSGKDSLVGAKGNDTLKGNAGKDTLKGGPGKDVLKGGPGRDRCVSGPGKDKVRSCER